MKRGTKCIAQTINLSNPETCIRPRQIQKLVDAEVMQPCPTSGSSYWTPRPVAVKVCSRRDMQRTCPPKLCDCPPKAPPKTVGQKFCKALLFVLKSGIAAGLVYWTHSEGLWGSSADVEDLYCRIMTTIAPALPEEYNGNDIKLPRMGLFKYRMIQRYNRMVFTIMNSIVSTSVKVREQLQRILITQDEKIQNEKTQDEITQDESSTDVTDGEDKS
ncbi:uncharacterized protein LOC128893677 [Hylaeus anthracinus]|uniref:uncharacterized protein LOC128893677 n=1 Tax=Hylaeus anthracinus TaxID=313031 RepID=UPI0023BA0864|nr:uncharacterized protein LOC128893677 [Hylaeus anthracinus]